MSRLLMLALALAIAWLTWSGLFKPLLLGLGLVSLLLVLWLSQRMKVTDREVFSVSLIHRLPGYWLWLAREVVKSNLTVARIVLSPKMPISPQVVTIKPPNRSLLGQAILANSITLTPGTVTVDAHDGVFLVHCLTRAGASELRQGEMGDRLHRAMGDR